MSRKPHDTQLGFDEMLSEASEQNRLRTFERETAHFPAAMEEAIPFFRELIEPHHAAMLAAAVTRVLALREEADKLALRLNGGAPGIIAGQDAPGRVLESTTAAAPGETPQ